MTFVATDKEESLRQIYPEILVGEWTTSVGSFTIH